MNTDLVKGFKDYLGEEAEKREFVKEVVKQTFERYGFQPAETPIIEYEEFVKSENTNDEAVSDIFKLEDKGKRKLALRYEQTFPLKRISKNQKLPFKRYAIGPVFRDEPATGNRVRQFTQCDIDIIGATIRDEAEILSLTNDILKSLKINAIIYINNRKLLEGLLEIIFNINKKEEKLDFIRVIDKLDKKSIQEVRKEIEIKYRGDKDKLTLFLNTLNLNNLDEIIKYARGVCINKKINYNETLFSKGEIELNDLLTYCKNYGVKVVFAPFLARGLSYYTGTIFEVKTKQIKETIFGGGTYIFNKNVSTGMSVSLERLGIVTNIKMNLEKYLIISLNQDKKAISLAQKLRAQGKNVSMYYGKPSKALEYANSYNIKKIIFVGDEEIKKKQFRIKDMISGKEVVLKV